MSLNRRIKRLQEKAKTLPMRDPDHSGARERLRAKLDALADRKASGDVTAQADIQELRRQLEERLNRRDEQ